MYTSPRASPLPVFAEANEFCTHCIALGIFDHCQKILFRINKKRFISPLIQMSAADSSRRCVNLSGMFVGQVVHEKSEVTVIARRKNYMPMIRHCLLYT